MSRCCIARSGVLAVLLILTGTACKLAPKALAPDAQTNVERLLRGYSARDELSAFVGTPPTSCLQNTPHSELCDWHAYDRLPGWEPMAKAIGTWDRINLICELPLSGAPREPGSCTAHPRRSNRTAWKTGVQGAGHRSVPASRRAEMREQNRRLADEWMAQADTLLRMSRLMGAVPNECESRSEAERMCLWRTYAGTFGHGTLTSWIGVSQARRVLLRCSFPMDGSPRAPNACSAEIGF